MGREAGGNDYRLPHIQQMGSRRPRLGTEPAPMPRPRAGSGRRGEGQAGRGESRAKRAAPTSRCRPRPRPLLSAPARGIKRRFSSSRCSRKRNERGRALLGVPASHPTPPIPACGPCSPAFPPSLVIARHGQAGERPRGVGASARATEGAADARPERAWCVTAPGSREERAGRGRLAGEGPGSGGAGGGPAGGAEPPPRSARDAQAGLRLAAGPRPAQPRARPHARPAPALPAARRESRERGKSRIAASMGSASSSYRPKAIYLDIDGRIQKVAPPPHPSVRPRSRLAGGPRAASHPPPPGCPAGRRKLSLSEAREGSVAFPVGGPRPPAPRSPSGRD